MILLCACNCQENFFYGGIDSKIDLTKEKLVYILTFDIITGIMNNRELVG